MGKYTKQKLLFNDISCKRVEVDFDGGEITSDAGILFLRETEERIGILSRIADVIRDKRHSSYVAHEILPLLKQPEGIILDIDDSDDPTHGARQMTMFNGYHNTYCYMPIHIYEGRSGSLITTILRPGKRPNGKEITAILKRLVNRIRAA